MHEASLVPTDQYHLYRWRMREPHPWSGFRRRIEGQEEYIEQVYQRVVDEGPLVAGDLKARVGKKGTWWDHDDGKTALEALFFVGRVSARRRPNDFARRLRRPRADDPGRRARPSRATGARGTQGTARARGQVPRRSARFRISPTTTASRRRGASRPWRSSSRRVDCSPSPCASGIDPRTCIPTRGGRTASTRARC